MNILKPFMALCLAQALPSVAQTSESVQPVKLTVDASRSIATVSKLFNGANIEDLNNQTNGGIFSQLLHGEAFEENIDVDFLNLAREDYSKVYVVLDERRIPHLKSQTDIYHRITWNNRKEKYDFNSKDIYDTRPLRHLASSQGGRFRGSSCLSTPCRRAYKKRCWNA